MKPFTRRRHVRKYAEKCEQAMTALPDRMTRRERIQTALADRLMPRKVITARLIAILTQLDKGGAL